MHWKEDLRAAAVQGVSGLMLDASIVQGALSLVRFAHPRIFYWGCQSANPEVHHAVHMCFL